MMTRFLRQFASHLRNWKPEVSGATIQLMTRDFRVAGSLVLSSLNSVFVGAALALGYSGISPWWAAVTLWVSSLPLVLFTTAYIIADVVKPSTRKQALIASALFVPTAVVEWYFRFTGI